ncbi:Adenosine deaminase-like protein [Caenorhabditis elegans]|uniref:Adenosine deaminase-like protein n=1 Tax=Caenorhabditis elegans TaxID=6239 RepID=ADAL_CAEEL|nr:Adenosine deaminase-like protein [Caenorhabditis elegans]Q8IG39.2 RecName: Full=Adenosine deaminase-like protein [Caenorhabditis elegans]CCD61565.1 Adenosine deaminase-like protein [Caenorhabditis elegans]|eukprot:NP_871955.2 Adenosine deaminase-like protein [Caenorhabditis elegans]
MPNNSKHKKKQQRRQQEAQKKSRAKQIETDKKNDEFLDTELDEVSPLVIDDDMTEFKNMPKVELHAHLSGSLSPETIKLIMESDETRAEEIMKKYKLEKPENMTGVFDCFPVIHAILRKPEAIRIAIRQTIKEFEEDNCVYLELRTSPKETDFMTYEDYLQVCIESFEAAKHEFPRIKTFLIVSLDRRMPFETAAHILGLIGEAQQRTNVIVGVELSGDPHLDGRRLLKLFVAARRFHGLGITIHLAEVLQNMADVEDYLNLRPDRIGHGTFLHTDPYTEYLTNKYKIPLEICLSSNVYSKTTTNYRNSHFNYWRKRGVPVFICTDDKGVIPGATLTEEYYKAAITFDLSTEELIGINQDALLNSFAYKYNVTDLTETFRKINNNVLD